MAATTEATTWINYVQGVSPRNGTVNREILFGFTAAVGSLLVVTVYGAVTHTETTGTWTKRMGPVTSGELSVFTKTSTGDNKISLQHNGSNYPVQYLVQEYAAGSVYVNGASANDTAETIPAVGGLPGTEVVVTMAWAVSVASTTTTASSVWGYPITKDRDNLDPGTPTDGSYMTVAHQINVTATSYQGTVTVTRSATFLNTDRQRVAYAVNAVVPPTPAPLGGAAIEWYDASGILQQGYLTWVPGTDGREQFVGSYELTS